MVYCKAEEPACLPFGSLTVHNFSGNFYVCVGLLLGSLFCSISLCAIPMPYVLITIINNKSLYLMKKVLPIPWQFLDLYISI